MYNIILIHSWVKKISLEKKKNISTMYWTSKSELRLYISMSTDSKKIITEFLFLSMISPNHIDRKKECKNSAHLLASHTTVSPIS